MKHDKNKLYKDIKLILNEDFTDRELPYLSKERDSAWIYLYLINDDYLRCYLLINLT